MVSLDFGAGLEHDPPRKIPQGSEGMKAALRSRRQKLADLVEAPVLLWSGRELPRNFPANTYLFRASSHFLYFAGLPLSNAVILLRSGCADLFFDPPPPNIWGGVGSFPENLAEVIGVQAIYPISELVPYLKKQGSQEFATVAIQDEEITQHQTQVLGRSVSQPSAAKGIDRQLVDAIITIRLHQDDWAVNQMRRAAAATMQAHTAGMAATCKAYWESEVRAAMESTIIAQGMTCAYPSIVTVHGEILHNSSHHNPLTPDDLILADVGAETEFGWAADVTRTWPVSGKFSSTQRALYDVVLQSHKTALSMVKPGVENRAIHEKAALCIAEGLVDLGILRGQPEDLVDQDIHAAFFPHGIGHLLGLDSHDMEDLGDLAGYAPGRRRSERFGLCYLRLDRPLAAGMVVTIEPGFYQIPFLLQSIEWRSNLDNWVNWTILANFSDVRGIRIENDVLVTETGHEVLTSDLPIEPDDIEEQL
jgi:Xaa-Pro aminopeptidase